MDDISDIGAFYDNNPQAEHLRLEQHQLEYDLTWRYFDEYLPAQGRILEIGAATGRYTLELARRGYTVTAVDLSPELLKICEQRVMEAGVNDRVTFLVADARDLSGVSSADYDVVLLMGPLYHLIAESDRKAALQQAYDRLRVGGIFMSAMLSRFGVMGDLLRNKPAWIENPADAQSMLAHGKRPDAAPRGGFRAYSAIPAEVVPLHEGIGFETLTLAGVEPAIGSDEDIYNRLQGNQRELWLDMLYTMSAEPSIIGASRHLLYVGKK